MTNQAQDKRPHFVLSNTSVAKPFTAHNPGGGDTPHVPQLPRAQHGASLQTQLQTLKPIAEQAAATQLAIGLEGGVGLQIQFQKPTWYSAGFLKVLPTTRST